MTGSFHRLRALLIVGCAVAIAASASLAHAAADPNKVVRWYFPTAETGFDPAKISDLYSATINEAIFERLLTYDYMANPAKLAPMVAEAMPEVTDDGRTYTFHLRKGIYFADDPAFKGAKRELTAQDFVYSYLRFVDPRNRAPYAFLVAGKFEGVDELAAAAEKTGRFDYDAKVRGIEAVDRYTLRFRLKSRDYNFPYIAAHTSLGAVAREVIEAYGDDTMAHPVGTGPYRLAEWTRRSKMVLEANPDFRGIPWDFPVSNDPWDQSIAATMKGKIMPQAGRVEITVIEESQAVFLGFQGRQLDYIALPPMLRDKALVGDKLNADLAAQKVTLFRSVEPSITFTFLNYKDPIVGGTSLEKIALRRAIIMAYDVGQEVDVVRQGQAIALEMPIPPGIIGYDPNYRSLNRYDPELSNKLLDHFGYKKAADGWRTLPDGSPLVLRLASTSTGGGRELNELFKKNMDAIGLRLEIDISKFDENRKAAKACKLMMWGSGWVADYPDGDNFMQNFYGGNIGQSNNGCYDSPAFNKLYEQAGTIPNSPERDRLFLLMTRQLEIDGANILEVGRLRNELLQPWVQGYKKHPILQADFVYLDVDMQARAAAQ